MDEEKVVFDAHIRAAELHLTLDVLWRVANTFISNDPVLALEKLEKLKAAVADIKGGDTNNQAAFLGVLFGLAAATLDELHVHQDPKDTDTTFLDQVLKGIESATEKKKESEGGEASSM